MTDPNGSLLDYLRHHAPTMPEEIVRVAAWGGREVVLRGMTAGERDRFEAEALRRGQEKAEARGLNGGGGEAPRPGFRQQPRRNRRERAVAAATTMDMEEFRARTVAATIWENGGRLFDNDEGRRLLSRQPVAVLMPLFEASQRLNGFTDEDVEELTGGGFTPDPDGSSSSDLPSPSDEPSPSSNGLSEHGSSTSG